MNGMIQKWNTKICQIVTGCIKKWVLPLMHDNSSPPYPQPGVHKINDKIHHFLDAVTWTFAPWPWNFAQLGALSLPMCVLNVVGL